MKQSGRRVKIHYDNANYHNGSGILTLLFCNKTMNFKAPLVRDIGRPKCGVSFIMTMQNIITSLVY